MLNFLSGINCILLHWRKKLTLRTYCPNTYTVPMSIPLLSKANRGFRAVSSTITDTYLSIGDSFSDSVFRDLKRSSVKPWGARTKVNGDKTLSGGRINWSHSRSDWKKYQNYIKDHTYIMSAHFLTFFELSTSPSFA